MIFNDHHFSTKIWKETKKHHWISNSGLLIRTHLGGEGDVVGMACGAAIIMADETKYCMADLRWWQMSDSLRGYQFAVGDDMAWSISLAHSYPHGWQAFDLVVLEGKWWWMRGLPHINPLQTPKKNRKERDFTRHAVSGPNQVPASVLHEVSTSTTLGGFRLVLENRDCWGVPIGHPFRQLNMDIR